MKFPCGFLLERRCCERSGWRPRAFLPVYASDAEYRPCTPGKEIPGTFSRVETLVERGLHSRAFRQGSRVEHGFHPVILFSPETYYLLFTVDHEPQGHRLDTPGRKLGLYLLPQYRGEFETHEAVEHTPGLLGIHEVHVYVPRILYGFQDGILGDFVEDYPLGILACKPECLVKVPGYRLPLAVFIGSEPHDGSSLGSLLQICHYRLLVRRYLIDRLETIFYVDTELAFAQVPDMPLAGFDIEILSKKLLYGFRLGRRLYDYQILLHKAFTFHILRHRSPRPTNLQSKSQTE